MATYFSTAADLGLLPPGMRTDAELANVAALAEADVIQHFTQDPPYFLYTEQLGLQGFIDASIGVGEDITTQAPYAGAVVPQVRVYLRGYKADSADPLVDPNLKYALKRAIAEVIAWRLWQWKQLEPGVSAASGTDGGTPKSRTFRPTAEDRFPPEWYRWLLPYDSRPVLWGY